MPDYPFLKGHGTENDFVLLPDHDGSVHGDLSPDEMAQRVRALCDRRAGIGGDGVLRVVREDGGWFMDYRNSDGSVSEMCGNGIRVFARHLVDEGLVDGSAPIPVGTRDGLKTLTVDGDLITADMGTPRVLGETTVAVPGHAWVARHVDMGNPHAVAFVDSLDDAGHLLDPPEHDPATYPEGVNVEFVVRRGDRHVAMRVHERGSGETRSCGTGACAAMVAAAVADGLGPGSAYRVDVPGGTLTVTWTEDDRVLLTGPAVIVARGTTSL
ncbi:diaminopimelate epimerase [Nocardioides sp. MAH-18]|uniref:Diaminopimelate epimerase n=1 Tax=Nocardioides agri TaxID=2682843 RepID=A0A6L6XV93_9ACTN|nr:MULTISPECIES: diaminopimelate epimerase [unclassified Nocardioides]MBA2955863.1 diaminopimelate epimerase [Nocardioides sp. CGMCC 1.13656]MVQ50712.1 diaminopimelate epimerase [Nocardioides sp. MAH-18]